MSLHWLFATPLPAGLSLATLATASGELGDRRILQAEELVGRETARGIARKLGAYELQEELVRRLELEGTELGASGEFPALTPGRWGRFPDAESWDGLRARLVKEGGEMRGLLLTSGQREAFLGFLSRNRVSMEAATESVVDLARHFFHHEPLNVVVAHTLPRFHNQ